MAFRKPDFLKSPLEHFRSNIESIMAQKAAIFREKSVKKGLPFVYTLVFQSQEPELLTTISYGASFATTPEQVHKVELCLQMNSNDMAWAHVVGYLANQLRGDCPFNKGEIIRLGQAVSAESKLNSFVVVPATFTEFPSPVKDGRKSTGVHIMELIPIYEEEVLSISKKGLDAFLQEIGKNKTNPKRPVY